MSEVPFNQQEEEVVMTKLFYTDPLKAAWMCREFGVVYVYPNGYIVENGSPIPLEEGYFRIVDGCLPIFEPKEGDEAPGGWTFLNGRWKRWDVVFLGKRPISLRDGKAFFWPERK